MKTSINGSDVQTATFLFSNKQVKSTNTSRFFSNIAYQLMIIQVFHKHHQYQLQGSGENMKQICRKILITEYLGYYYLTYHHPQHLHLGEKTEKGTMIINYVLLYNRYISNWELILSFQQPSESMTTFSNATVSVVKKCFTVAFFCWRQFLLTSKFLQSYFSENTWKKYYFIK